MTQTSDLHPHDIAFNGISRQLREVTFIQIGAADGKRADPIYSFVNRYKWKGLLVEPLSDLFELLKKNYESREDLVFENVAIAENNESRTITRIPLDAVNEKRVPGWAFGVSTLAPEKTVLTSSNIPDDVQKILRHEKVNETVKCLTFESLLRKHNIAEFDVLQIDTEGYDAKIIMQINLSEYRPKLINFEWQWISDGEKETVSTYLKSHGYNLYPCGEDMLATIDTLDSYRIKIGETSPSTVPAFFANIAGMIANVVINPGDQSCRPYPARIEFVRAARDYRLSMQGDEIIYPLISCINGKNTISEISDIIHSDTESVIKWVHWLRELLILE